VLTFDCFVRPAPVRGNAFNAGNQMGASNAFGGSIAACRESPVSGLQRHSLAVVSFAHHVQDRNRAEPFAHVMDDFDCDG
jgi:broad specificity polyphosphatase/5'/3'-nucleotidase SurE